jgi:hypothetical protein
MEHQFLTRLVYLSTVTDIFKATDIEGSRADINSTYHKVLNDKRHTHIVMVDYKEENAREFSDWSMGSMPESSFSAPMDLKFSCTKKFSPHEMSGESAHLLMLSLKTSITSSLN